MRIINEKGKENIFLSIIIPICNGEEFLTRTLNCFRNQSSQAFEVVFVDDHSTDGSLYKLQNLEFNNRVLIPTEKLGNADKGFAYALDFCKGKYILYMSQDDFVEETFVEKMQKYAMRFSYPDVLVPVLIFYYENVKCDKIMPPYNFFFWKLRGKNAFYRSLFWKNIHGFCLRKADLVRKCGIIDNYFNGAEYSFKCMLLNARKVCYVKTYFYYNQENDKAISKRVNSHSVEALILDYRLYEKMMEEGFPSYKKRKYKKYLVNIVGTWEKKDYKELSDNERKYLFDQIEYIKNKLGN